MKNNIKAIFFLATLATLVCSANLFAQVNHTINISDFNDPDLLKNNLPNEPFNLIINGTGAIPDFSWNTSPFFENQNIISVVGNDVTVIGDHIFRSCYSLEYVNFPNATSIGNETFFTCTSLQTVGFPNVTNIGNNAFRYCPSLDYVNFPNVTSIGGCAFSSCPALASVNFPLATTIGDDAFLWCHSLEAISLGTAFTEPTEISVIESSPPALFYPSFYETENICLTLGENVLPKADGNLWNSYTWKCIEIASIQEPSQLTYSQIYPNPASDKTTLSLELASTCNIQVELVDVLGQEVLQIYDGLVAAGSFTRSFSTAKLAKGIYFVKIVIGSEYKLEKLVVL